MNDLVLILVWFNIGCCFGCLFCFGGSFYVLELIFDIIVSCFMGNLFVNNLFRGNSGD